MRCLRLMLALLLLSLTAMAADVAGDWKITIESPNGMIEATLTLKQDGEKLTGTIQSDMGQAPVTGTIKDNDVTFTMKMGGDGGTVVLLYKAKVDGDKLNGSFDFAGQGEIKFSGVRKT